METSQSDKRKSVESYAISVRDKLQYEIYTRLNLNRAVSGYISTNPDISREEYAEYISSLSYFWTGIISSMSFSKGHTLTYVAPYSAINNPAIGYDLYSNLELKAGLERCAEKNLPFVEGPRNMIGTDVPAIIAYLPVWIQDSITSKQVLYGFSDVCMQWDKIIQSTPLYTRHNDEVDIAIRGINGTGMDGEVFYGNADVFDHSDAVLLTVSLPLGNWVIAAYPHTGFGGHKHIYIAIYIAIFIISVALFLVTRYGFSLITESEKKYKMIAENTSDAIWTIDINTMNFTYMSHSISYISGHTARELIGKNIREVLSPESVIYSMKILKESIEKYNNNEVDYIHETFEVQHYTKNGNLIDCEVSATLVTDEYGKIMNVLGVTRNIDERKKLELQLAESEKKYRIIAENTVDAIWAVDFKTRKYTYVSPAIRDVSGYEPHEMLGNSVDDYIPKEYKELPKMKMDMEMIRFLRGEINKIHATYEVQKYHKDGTLVWCEIAETILPNENNELSEVLGITRRIDERKELEQLLVEQQHSLAELNATKDKFFSIIAHDLKNPLTALNNIVAIFSTHYKQLSQEEIEKDISRLHQSTDHILKLLENLLQWSRSSSGAMVFFPSPRDLITIINDTTTYLQEQRVVKNITLNIEINVEEVNVMIDLNMIETVFRNLLSNAIKFSNPDSTIRLIIDDYSDDMLKVSVSDTGVGMSDDKLNKLFQIGQKVSTIGTNKETGTGLGLILCKEFVDKHNCSIWVESILGQGTTFSFTLPKTKV
jgi:PAS domain S-box-containing protein